MTPEGKVKAKVKRILSSFTEMGVLYGEWPVPGGYGKSGLDYHGCILGHYFAIETKAEGGRLTTRQEWCAEKIRKAGGRVFTIKGVNDPTLLILNTWLEGIVVERK